MKEEILSRRGESKESGKRRETGGGGRTMGFGAVISFIILLEMLSFTSTTSSATTTTIAAKVSTLPSTSASTLTAVREIRGVEDCDKIVVVESYGGLNYLGNVTFTAPTPFKGQWRLEMKTNVPFAFLGGWGVRFKNNETIGRSDIYSADIVNIQAGEKISFRFRISYGLYQPVPYVCNLKWQNIQICNETTRIPGGSGKIRTGLEKEDFKIFETKISPVAEQKRNDHDEGNNIIVNNAIIKMKTLRSKQSWKHLSN